MLFRRKQVPPQEDLEKGNLNTNYSNMSNKYALQSMVLVVLVVVLFCFSFSLIFTSEQEFSSPSPFELFADLLTQTDQEKELSYGWYKKQLDTHSLLGKHKFLDGIITKMGFQDTLTTSESWFYYFRTYNVEKECSKQHSSRIYPLNYAKDEIKLGNNLDGVVYHFEYKPPFIVDPPETQSKNILNFHDEILKRKVSNIKQSITYAHQIDKQLGEKMWKGMKRLNIFMNSEAAVEEQLKPHIQNSDFNSLERFSKSDLDISVCFQRNCTVWVNYLYGPIEILKTQKHGSHKSKNKGICAFISNCIDGNIAKQRMKILSKLSEYVPIRQYGKCGNNVKEGSGGKQHELENNCRFYFAVENSIVTDYITEKFFEGVKAIQNGAKLLIIYKGPPNFRELGFPKSLTINIDDYESSEILGEYLKKLSNEEEFEKRWNEITLSDFKSTDKAIQEFNHDLGLTTPCRMLRAVGMKKLARYLLFKIGLIPTHYKVNYREWNAFKSRFNKLDEKKLKLLDEIYIDAYADFSMENNFKNKYNSGIK